MKLLGPKTIRRLKTERGSILVTGIIMLSFLSLYGAAMMSRMIVDANSSARKVNASKAYYIAEAGIQWGRKYLVANSNDISLGPINFASGTLTVAIIRETIKLNAPNNNQQVYRILSTAVLGETSRRIEELRYRGGGLEKQFLLYREDIEGEF